jgi:DNA replication and repair protein RecF
MESHLRIRHLSLTDIRNHHATEIVLPAGCSAFIGSNGQGKTNIVEAIYYLSTLSSHRVATDAPIIAEGASTARIAAEVVRDDRVLTIDIELLPGKANRARINRSPVARPREILGILKTVMFAPEDLSLVKGDPSERRKFLDDLLIQRQPRWSGVRVDYDRVLRQRNALLKSVGVARRANSDTIDSTLAVWDEQLVRFGAELMRARATLVADLLPRAQDVYAQVAPASKPLTMSYEPSTGSDVDVASADQSTVEQILLEHLHAKRKEECDRGITLVGPHRDELKLNLGSMPVKGFASQGESWSVALALRLASFDLLSAEGPAPILILDDVFAELDTHRRTHLAERIAAASQVLITAAVADDVPHNLVTEWFTVEDGQVRATGGGQGG